jgi:MFS transporter, PAT family, beta-lactamase induction signal transducer AmpG
MNTAGTAMHADGKLARLSLLAALYFSQGLPFGFFTQALPVLLREQKLSLGAIGLTSLLAIPWALKFLWAPLIDRHGTRRAWLIPLQLGSACLMVVIGLIDPKTALQAILITVVLTNLLASTQDIATDALAVDLLPPEERGMGNGVQVAGYRAGMIVGGGALLIAFDRLGWTLTFWLMAALLALATLPVALSPQARVPRAPSPAPASGAGGSARGWLKLPGQYAWIAALILYKLGDALGQGMLRPFMSDLGMELGDVGLILGTAGFSTGLIGALLGGWGVERLGRPRALLLFGLLQTIAVGLYAWPAMLGKGHALTHQAMWTAAMIEHLTGGMATAALFTWMMDRCRPDHAGADYTLQACIVVIATGVAQATSGFIAQYTGWPAHFLLSAALSLLGLVAITALLPRLRDVAQRTAGVNSAP